MKALSHAAILEAGRYSGVRIGAGEAENAKLLYRFMLRLRLTSVEKTGRLCGVSAEVIACVAERSGRKLKSEPVRICHPDSHTPMSSALETVYYPEEALAVERLRSLAAGK